MKKTTRMLFSLMLALSMVLGLCSVVCAEGDEKKYHNYYMMGDSIPQLIGEDMTTDKDYLGYNEGIYPELVAQHYGVESLYWGANQGWRTHEARISINKNYDGDEHTEKWEYAWAGDKLVDIQKKRDQNIAALAAADMITINLGNNNLVAPLVVCVYKVFGTAYLKHGGYEEDLEEILETAKALPVEEALYYLLEQGSEFALDAAEVLDLAKVALPQAMAEFCDSWDALIDDVRAVNASAPIVVVGMYNALGSAAKKNVSGISDEVVSMLDAIAEPTVKYFNSYMSSGSSRCSEYVFADVYDVDLTGSEEGSHLGKAGHQYFADQIIRAFDSLECDHANRTLKDVKEATRWTLGYSGDEYCQDCGKLLNEGHITVYVCRHEQFTIVGAVSPTRFTYGFTGNVVCKDCYKILSFGKIVRPVLLRSLWQNFQ